MNKREADAYFIREIFPLVRGQYEADGVPDYPARSAAWSDWIDGLCKDGKITPAQYAQWAMPRLPKRGYR